MKYIEESLSSGEEIEELFRLHWFSKVPMVIWIILAPFTVGLTLILAVFEWLRLKNIEQGLTNKRVILKSGIISRKTEEIRLSAVETVELTQSIFGRIFGFGVVKVTGRGVSNLLFSKVVNPISVKRSIENFERE